MNPDRSVTQAQPVIDSMLQAKTNVAAHLIVAIKSINAAHQINVTNALPYHIPGSAALLDALDVISKDLLATENQP